VSEGLAAAEWSPDGELLVAVSRAGRLLVMNTVRDRGCLIRPALHGVRCLTPAPQPQAHLGWPRLAGCLAEGLLPGNNPFPTRTPTQPRPRPLPAPPTWHSAGLAAAGRGDVGWRRHSLRACWHLCRRVHHLAGRWQVLCHQQPARRRQVRPPASPAGAPQGSVSAGSGKPLCDRHWGCASKAAPLQCFFHA
jgi:hypothetical protein